MDTEIFDCFSQGFIGELIGSFSNLFIEGDDSLCTFFLCFDIIFKVYFEQVKLTLFPIDKLKDLFELKFKIFILRLHLCIQFLFDFISQLMSKNRFEYNFTRQSQYEQLKERNQELQEENSILKQSLEELIRVNTQLTQSIEELNNASHNHENNEEVESKLEMLINQNQNLRQMLENQAYMEQENQQKKSLIQNNEQTESLVNVLEQLIESFKSIETKYQNQIRQLQESIEQKEKDFQEQLVKVQHQLQGRINTIEALSIQLKRKDQNLEHIINVVNQYEKDFKNKSSVSSFKAPDVNQVRMLEKKLDGINKELAQKNRVIHVYENLLNNLKGKIMEKI